MAKAVMIQWTRQLIKTLSSKKRGMMMMMMIFMILISPNTIYMVIQSTQRQHNPLNQGVLPPQPVVSQYL